MTGSLTPMLRCHRQGAWKFHYKAAPGQSEHFGPTTILLAGAEVVYRISIMVHFVMVLTQPRFV